jgi:hypothetical protein
MWIKRGTRCVDIHYIDLRIRKHRDGSETGSVVGWIQQAIIEFAFVNAEWCYAWAQKFKLEWLLVRQPDLIVYEGTSEGARIIHEKILNWMKRPTSTAFDVDMEEKIWVTREIGQVTSRF